MSLLSNTNLQFVTLSFIKSHFKITDTQDDNTLLAIAQDANLEVKKQIIAVADDLDLVEGSIFFQPAQSAALKYVEAEIRRQINQLYTEADTIMAKFKDMMLTLISEIRSQAPERTARRIASREIDFEDDFFAERRFP